MGLALVWGSKCVCNSHLSFSYPDLEGEHCLLRWIGARLPVPSSSADVIPWAMPFALLGFCKWTLCHIFSWSKGLAASNSSAFSRFFWVSSSASKPLMLPYSRVNLGLFWTLSWSASHSTSAALHGLSKAPWGAFQAKMFPVVQSRLQQIKKNPKNNSNKTPGRPTPQQTTSFVIYYRITMNSPAAPENTGIGFGV